MSEVYTQDGIQTLRTDFENAVKEVFDGDASSLLDVIENGEYSPSIYDVFYDYNDETYIINRSTGEYINWYKFTHIGRDIHTTISDPTKDNFVKFLKEFKDSLNDDIDISEEQLNKLSENTGYVLSKEEIYSLLIKAMEEEV